LQLEERRLLAVFTVMNANSSGTGSLAQAIAMANVNNHANIINFDPTYFATRQTITLGGSSLELSDTGGMQTIMGPAKGVIVSGGGQQGGFVIQKGVNATLSELTITDGYSPGGGLYNLGTVKLTDCTITGNSAVNNSGGGVLNNGTATLIDCTISANRAGTGGGMFSTGKAYLSGCTISGNSGNGGGVYNAFSKYGGHDSGQLTLSNCTISGNGYDATRFGGGLENYGGTATLTDCTISKNNARFGAGAYNKYGTLNLTDCTISGNKATANIGYGFGGGVSSRGNSTLTNCTIFGNYAEGHGGGFNNYSGTATFRDCTISGNSGYGVGAGGLANGGTAMLTGTIVARNTNYSGASDIASGTVVTGSHNLIGTGGSGGLTNGVNGNLVGIAAPGVGSLGNYGGPTQTMALSPGSPAIGKGTAVPGVTTDQRGVPRGTTIDIGAYQYSLVIESNAGSVNTAPAQLTLAGAVSLTDVFAGPVRITFDPAVFSGAQTIILTAPLELQTDVSICTITTQGLAPGTKVTVSGENSRVFQIDKGVMAYLSGLTITSTSAAQGAGLEVLGAANLADCTFTGTAPASGGAIEVSGGTLTVNGAAIEGWQTGIHIVNNSVATVASASITGNGAGISVGSTKTDSCSVTIKKVDLSGNSVGVQNIASRPVGAMDNWWGSSFGPNTTGASTTTGNVVSSPWLGDIASLNLSTPDSLGFASAAGNSYTVTPNPNGQDLRISLTGNPNAPWTVTQTGTVLFVGTGGNVTINGESGAGYTTNAFTMTTSPPGTSPLVSSSVEYIANDAFNGATVYFSGSNFSPVVNAKGTNNTFIVSGWTGAATLTALAATGTISTVLATKSVNTTLTNTSLFSADGMNLTLSRINTANLTANTSSGSSQVIVDASAFAGVTNLTASGPGTAILFGGGTAGKNGGTLMVTGPGNNILIGGPGLNKLTDNGSGRNILLGGGGPNTITGNRNDILLTGTTIYNPNTAANIAALDAILAEWTSSDSYGARISKILNGITVGSNTYALNSATVHSNSKANTVSDGPMKSQNQNWFIVNSTDQVTKTSQEKKTVINT
jgi:hypothetical protein